MLPIAAQAVAAPPSIIEQAVALAVATKMKRRFGSGVDEIEIILRRQWSRHKPKLLEDAANLTGSIGVYAFFLALPKFWATANEITTVLHKMDEFKDIKDHVTAVAFRDVKTADMETADMEDYDPFVVYIGYDERFDEEFEKCSCLRMQELGR